MLRVSSVVSWMSVRREARSPSLRSRSRRASFSTSTTASSTTTPRATRRPASIMVLSVAPVRSSTITAVRSESGMDTTLMSALRQSNRNAPMTRTTRTAPNRIARARLANESSMYDASRKTPGSMSTPGRPRRSSASAASTPRVTSSVFPSANTLEVTRGVEAALAELRRGLPGVDIDPGVFRLASYIEDSFANLARAILFGAVLVVLVIGAFLFDWRSALISVVSIPLSLLTAVIVLDLTGATLNTMMLAGLLVALGVVVDDAVVDVEKLARRLRERKEGDRASLLTLIHDTTLETRSIAIYATLIVVLAVMPIFFMGGISGALFTPLARSYVLAVVASMAVALSVTPALSLILLGARSRRLGEPPVAAWLPDRYETALGVVIRAPRVIYSAAGVVLVVGVAVAPFLGQSLLPAFKERDLLVNVSTAPRTSYAEPYRIPSRVR